MAKSPQQIAQKLASQLQAGQFGAAAKLAKTATKQFPKESHFANVAATALINMDRTREALPFFAKALQLMPGHEEYQNNLIHAYIVAKQHEKANELIERFLPTRKDTSKLLHLKAFSAKLRANREEIIAAATKGLEQEGPLQTTFLEMRGMAYHDQNDFGRALADFDQLLEIDPDNCNALQLKANLLLDNYQTKDAIALLEDALERRPKDCDLLAAMASARFSQGDVERAHANLDEAMKINPNSSDTLIVLAKSLKGDVLKKYLPMAQEALKAHPKGSLGWCNIQFALGHMYFASHDYQAAGRHFEKANNGLSKLEIHRQEAEEAKFGKILAATPAGPCEWTEPKEGQPKPILVVGQPRSGTTLTEMVLSSHPDVASCGELMNGAVAAKQFIDADLDFDPKLFESEYRGNLPEQALRHPAFVDKMPSNYRNIGMFLHGLPGVRIIHIERDPRDVALSMWKERFKADGLRFTNDLVHIAQQANLYRRYMRHWEKEFPGQFLTIRYDDLVSDLETTSKKMAEFAGLDWTEAMMSPERNKASVRTASVVQVREGVHKKSIGGWHRMEEALRPFNKALDLDLWPELEW